MSSSGAAGVEIRGGAGATCCILKIPAHQNWDGHDEEGDMNAHAFTRHRAGGRGNIHCS